MDSRRSFHILLLGAARSVDKAKVANRSRHHRLYRFARPIGRLLVRPKPEARRSALGRSFRKQIVFETADFRETDRDQSENLDCKRQSVQRERHRRYNATTSGVEMKLSNADF